jgi:hypothetical protein
MNTAFSYQSTPLIEKERRKIQISYDGTVTVWNPQIVTHYCAMVVDNFPYDTQTCTITLSPWTTPGNIVAAHIQPPSSDELMFQSITSTFRVSQCTIYRVSQKFMNTFDDE